MECINLNKPDVIIANSRRVQHADLSYEINSKIYSHIHELLTHLNNYCPDMVNVRTEIATTSFSLSDKHEISIKLKYALHGNGYVYEILRIYELGGKQ